MFEASIISDVLKQFAIAAFEIESLGNAGGFSGSKIYRVSTPKQTYCLKKWPTAFDIENLHWIHRVLIFATANGCSELATPKLTLAGDTFLTNPHGTWELTNWAAGDANYLDKPTDAKLKSAIECLARFHQATARFHFNFAPSQNVSMALDRLNSFDSIMATVMKTGMNNDLVTPQQIYDFANKGRALASDLTSRLAQLQIKPLPVQPVIRDFRAEHLYFDGDKLVAVIDFGAMRVDSVACDLARIIGDISADDETVIENVLLQYDSIRPLQETERQLAKILNRASIVIGILNWLDWLIIQRREFDHQSNVRARIKTLFDRL